MEIVKKYVKTMPKDICANEFCHGITSHISALYKQLGLDMKCLEKHPEERLTASAVIYSAYYRQIWMIGDCQCMMNCKVYDNPKQQENIIAEKRSVFLCNALQHTSIKDIQQDDLGRAFIMADLIEKCKGQNINYSVIDGFDIPLDKTKFICVDNYCHEIVLASDGYPFLCSTLKESERLLDEQLKNDPLCISSFKATKGLMKGNRSFDDRSYIRFSI